MPRTRQRQSLNGSHAEELNESITMSRDNFTALLTTIQQSNAEVCERMLERLSTTAFNLTASPAPTPSAAEKTGNFARCSSRFSGSAKENVETFIDAIEAYKECTNTYDEKLRPYPEVFTGLLEPWRGVLLHGPPGTGKTMLARAVAGESCCTFFNVSCSTIVNKWRGETEKIIKVLFEMASYYSPSIIFMDEIETLASDRSSPGEHEASRRLKAQLLTEIDGIGGREGIIFILANSNMPWDIDPAMLRRLEKRIYIPLPEFKTREELFQKYLTAKNVELFPKVDFKELASKTEGYSGSDIKLVCKEALMSTVRKLLPSMSVKGHVASRKDRLDLSEILTAIEKTKPVSKNLTRRHVEWQNEMGCS